jgi:hypothetical protein
MDTTGIFRVEVGQLFPALSVFAELSGLVKFPPTTGWLLELTSSLVSRSPTLGWMITEWLCRSVVAMIS